jgi:hypothetical protein
MYAAGAVNHYDIDKLETQLIREQFNLKGDVLFEDIEKILKLFTTKTSEVIREKDSALRLQV